MLFKCRLIFASGLAAGLPKGGSLLKNFLASSIRCRVRSKRFLFSSDGLNTGDGDTGLIGEGDREFVIRGGDLSINQFVLLELEDGDFGDVLDGSTNLFFDTLYLPFPNKILIA